MISVVDLTVRGELLQIPSYTFTIFEKVIKLPYLLFIYCITKVDNFTIRLEALLTYLEKGFSVFPKNH
jgi:hypothetical protein